MSTIPPGWYKDPADPTTQRWWDGEGWLGDPIPADATPPDGPPPVTVAPPEPPAAPGPGMPPSGPIGPGATIPTGPGGPATWPMSHRHPVAVPRPHGYLLAGLGARFMARLVDALVVLVLASVANVWFAIEFWRNFEPVVRWALRGPASFDTMPASAQQASTMLSLMCLVLTAVWFAYEVPASANTGQTLGKRIFGIRVVPEESDERLGFRRSFWRWFRMAWPTPFWVYCGGVLVIVQIIDCLFLFFDGQRRQALHDRITQTLVVQVPRAGQSPTTPPAGAGTPGQAPTSPSGSSGDGHADSR